MSEDNIADLHVIGANQPERACDPDQAVCSGSHPACPRVTGHYLNRSADSHGSVLQLIRAFRDRIETSAYARWRDQI